MHLCTVRVQPGHLDGGDWPGQQGGGLGTGSSWVEGTICILASYCIVFEFGFKSLLCHN